MVVTNDRKARLLDLTTGVLELVRDGKRDPDQVAQVLQVIKDQPNFAQVLFPATILPGSVQSQLKEWQRFYKGAYNFKLNFSNLRIPEYREGFDQLLVMVEGLTLQRIVETMQKSMKVCLGIDLSRVTSDRNPDRTYAIWLRDRQEADEELKNLSANGLKAKGINSITLPERLMLEFFYWWKTKKYLDISNVTLCGGSRYPYGYVPCVYWDSSDGEVGVYWYFPDWAYGYLRARQAVS